MLLKVSVEGKGVLDDMSLHQGETGAIGETVFFVLMSLEDLPALSFYLPVHPEDSC